MYAVICIIFISWILFFGGASRLVNTFAGYLEFGVASEKAIYIKMLSWIGLVFSVGILFFAEAA